MTPLHRVLHVVTPAAAGCGPAMMRLLGLTRRLLPEYEHRLLVVGPASASRMAQAVGAGDHRRLPPVIGAPRFSARAIRRAITGAHADLVHVWDAESCAIVIDGRPFEAVAATLGAVPPRSTRMPLAQDRAEALCLGERARRQALDAGWLHARVQTVLPPAEIEFAREVRPPWARAAESFMTGGDVPSAARVPGATGAPDAAERRRALRDRWGFDDATVAVGVVGEPWQAIDGRLAFDMAGRAWLSGSPVRLVIDPRVVAAAELRRWAALTSLHRVVVEEPSAARPWEIFAGLDAVLLTEAASRSRSWFGRWIGAPCAAPSGALPLLWAMDSGLTVVSTRDGPLESFGDPKRAVAVDALPNVGARQLRELRSRPADAAPVNAPDSARTAASWAAQVRALYERAAVAAGGAFARDMSAVAASR